jgi:2-hydroxycyclohexanecarboxyl-CoA dehydrogenase
MTAVITGAGGTIGRQIAIEISASQPVAVLDLNAEAAETTAQEILAKGGEAKSYAADNRDGLVVREIAGRVRADLGTVSTLVNCAGWDAPARFDETTEDVWRTIVDINYLGMLVVTAAFLDLLRQGVAPRSIINISSDAARIGSSQEAVYSGAKAAVIGFSKALAREVARDAITVNCIAPGPTDTPMLDNLDPRVLQSMVKSIPLRRVATASDIAGAAAFFASPAASYITGQVLSVSGGLTMVG